MALIGIGTLHSTHWTQYNYSIVERQGTRESSESMMLAVFMTKYFALKYTVPLTARMMTMVMIRRLTLSTQLYQKSSTLKRQSIPSLFFFQVNRHFSSNNDNNNSNNSNNSNSSNSKTNNNTALILYQRDISFRRSFRPRAMLSMASFHTAYWVWYVADFIPAVNASSNADVHVDPSIGLLGLFVAASINAGVVWYSKSLVTEIALSLDNSDTNHKVLIKTQSLPFLRPSNVANSHTLGTVLMDQKTVESKGVIESGSFDQALGHLLVKDHIAKSSYLLEVKAEEVFDERKLMQVLTNPKGLFDDMESERVLERVAATTRRKARQRETIHLVPDMMKARRSTSNR